MKSDALLKNADFGKTEDLYHKLFQIPQSRRNVKSDTLRKKQISDSSAETRKPYTCFGDAEFEFEYDSAEIASQTRFIGAAYGDDGGILRLLPVLQHHHVLAQNAHGGIRRIPKAGIPYSDAEIRYIGFESAR